MQFGERDSNRSRGSRGPIPVKEGETYDVEIEGIGEKGDGIAKVNGYVIIVPGVKKGDNVKVRINAVRGKVSFGEVIGEGAPRQKEETTDEPSEESEDDMGGEDSEGEDMDEGLGEEPEESKDE